MLGGDRSFDLGEYDNTPIADILPVRLGLRESYRLRFSLS